MKKSSVEVIRERFDNDVERFSNLESGQVSTIDAKLSLELITDAAAVVFGTSHKSNQGHLLDIGAGAGNYSLQMLSKIPHLDCTLIDLSLPMLQRAEERMKEFPVGNTRFIQGDIREVELRENQFDIVLAGAVLHHLRTDEEWEFVFTKIYKSLRPGGSFWISDLVEQEHSAINQLMMQRYKAYLETVGGDKYAANVLAYIDQEDTPKSVTYQVNLLAKVGFAAVEILHKNTTFAAFGAIK